MPLLKAREFVLVIGPCGAGKTTYARAHYPQHAQPDHEALIRALTPDGCLHYYPELRVLSLLLQRRAVQQLLAKEVAVCVTTGGATRKERAEWRALAAWANVPVSCIHLRVDAATCLARAKADKNRPDSSRGKWAEIIDNWFRAWQPVETAAEGIARYEEVPW